MHEGGGSLLLLPLHYLLIPISCLYPPGLYSSLRFYLSPPGSLLTSQLVFECLCSLNSSLSYTLISYESSRCYLVSKLPLVDYCVLKLLNVTCKPSYPPTYPHSTDKTDYTGLLIVAFHLHAFLLTVLSFWMITLHFCPMNFFSSFKMYHRCHLFHEAFPILPTRCNFIFPRTLILSCNTVGTHHILPCILYRSYSCTCFPPPPTPRASTKPHSF